LLRRKESAVLSELRGDFFVPHVLLCHIDQFRQLFISLKQEYIDIRPCLADIVPHLDKAVEEAYETANTTQRKKRSIADIISTIPDVINSPLPALTYIKPEQASACVQLIIPGNFTDDDLSG